MVLRDVKKILLVYVMLSGYGYAQDFEVPLTVTDGFNSQNLTIGVNRDGTDDFDPGLDNYAPPSPPSGSFDTRLTWNFVDYFKDIRDNSITEKTFVITYQPGTSGSIIIYWDRDTLSALGTFTLVDNVTGTMFNLDMTTEDSLDVSSNSILDFGIKILLTPLPRKVAVDELSFNTMRNFKLFQNFPNPFNPITRINFYMPKSDLTILTVFNLSGQEVIQLIEREFNWGYHQVIWDASNMASGVYLYRLQAGDFVQTRKMLLLK